MTNDTGTIQRIGICTGGGDAPGLNAVIRAVAVSAINRGWECYGIAEGFNGLLFPERFPGCGLVRLDRDRVRGITHLGGTILGTTNRGNPFSYPVTGPDGVTRETDLSDNLMKAFWMHGIYHLVAVGGDGTLAIAHGLEKKGLKVVGVPKTIDNDLDKTVITFGYDTAVSFATECLDRLYATAQSHQRIMVVEVMGRYAGWIALNTGVSGAAHAILIPEIPYDIRKVADHLRKRAERGRPCSIVVVAEGAKPVDGGAEVVEKQVGSAERLGGIGEKVTRQLSERTGKECRCVVLGHLLRGGSPTTFDRLIALRFGAAAVRALHEGQSGIMVALDPPRVRYVPLGDVAGRFKAVPVDCDTIMTARELGICFGD